MKRVLITAFLVLVFVCLKAADEDSTKPKGLLEQLQLTRERPLFVKAEVVRFLNENGQTEFNINYKVPNNELQFIQTKDGYIANLEVVFNIYLNGQLVSPNKFSHSAGARTIGIAQSKNHYVLDKISLTLEREGFSAEFEIMDKNASTMFKQHFDLLLFNKSSMISDIEISNGISTELTDALLKFERGQFQFYVDPLPVIDGSEKDFIVYHEITNITQNQAELYNFHETISIKKFDTVTDNATVVWTEDFNKTVDYVPYPVITRIPLGDYQPGVYTIQITVKDPINDRTQTTERSFSISREYFLQTQRIFSNDEDEFALMSYFLDTRQKRQWRELNEQGKKSFIERFWIANNPNPASKDNLFLDTIRLRVNEANWRYSHHREGWRTDLGRIYIKHGAPNDLEKKSTDGDIRTTRRDYQIWRYLGSDKVYLFMDFQTNGNYRLIYTKNDDDEASDPGWKTYFGADFDIDSLRL